MNLNNIKTKTQFYEFADIWYQRVHQLREVWQDISKPIAKRLKALILFTEMTKRVMHLNQIAIKISKPKPPKFIKGGVTAKINYKT